MNVFSQLADAQNAFIGEIAAFRENKISDMRHGWDNAIHSLVRQIEQAGEV